MNTPILQLIDVSNRYCAATQRTRSAVSKRVFNDGKVLDKLLAGGDLTTSRHQMALLWFSQNWPDNADWPAEVTRPCAVDKGPEAA